MRQNPAISTILNFINWTVQSKVDMLIIPLNRLKNYKKIKIKTTD